MTWKLVGVTEPIVGQTLLIEKEMLIGRHQQADIVLQASHVSRRHALLRLQDEQLWIEDLGSSNGTFVNGQKITQQQLHVNDEINFESIRFKVEQQQAEGVIEKSELEKEMPSDEGMPTLKERAADIKTTVEGMPTNVGIPKPAPIPEHIDINNIQPEAEIAQPVVSEQPVEKAQDQKKNAKVGLVSFVVIIILIILAALAFGR